MTAGHQPDLPISPHAAGVLEELRRLEPIVHPPVSDDACVDHEQMPVDDGWEIGACGRRYSRANLLARRAQQPDESDWERRLSTAANWRRTSTCSPTPCAWPND